MEMTRTVRAVQWDGKNKADVKDVAGNALFDGEYVVVLARRPNAPPKPILCRIGEWVVDDGGLSVKADETFREQYPE